MVEETRVLRENNQSSQLQSFSLNDLFINRLYLSKSWETQSNYKGNVDRNYRTYRYIYIYIVIFFLVIESGTVSLYYLSKFLLNKMWQSYSKYFNDLDVYPIILTISSINCGLLIRSVLTVWNMSTSWSLCILSNNRLIAQNSPDLLAPFL